MLVVSASAGTGHLRAGEALAGAARAAGAHAEHVDVLSLAPRWVRAVYGGGFELLAARAPNVWGGIYRLADGPGADSARWGLLAESLLFRAFRRLLLADRWDVCVCTHFLPSQLAAGRAGMPPFALVLTDFAEHRFWIQPRVRRYFVATQRLADLIADRVPGAVATASGIPITPTFTATADRAAARRDLDLDPHRPLALVVGGGWGLGVEDSARAAAPLAAEGVGLVIVCGRNDGAHERLQAACAELAHVRVLGYTHDMARYMSAADVVVTKPGGLTCSEALAAGRPLVLVRSIPGHEAANAAELVRQGAALSATDAAGLQAALRQLLSEPALRARSARTAAQLGRPNAAHDIVTACLHEFAHAAAA